MPLFKPDDYANLHPEIGQVPAGMTDETFMIDMQLRCVNWFEKVVQDWPESADEVTRAFCGESPLWAQIAPRHETDLPELTFLTTTGSCLANLVGCIHPETREAVINHLNSIAKLRRCDCAVQEERVEVDQVFLEIYRYARNNGDDAALEFLMRLLDLAHNVDGVVDSEKSIRLAQSIVVASISLVVGTADREIRTAFIEALKALASRVAADPILPYFQTDAEM